MTATLLVPVRLDALLLESDEPVVQAAADFSRLPWSDGTRDVNPDTANLGEEIVAHPFESQALFLKPGVHLHWALPDTLTHAERSAVGTVFPPVPNRWVVMRSRGGGPVEWARVIESDFLWPEGKGAETGAISVPVTPDPARGRRCPFRYQGRGLALDAWPPAPDADAEYLPGLTAVGYGEPNFATVYVNCRGVFGTHDPLPADQAPGARYDLLGWYAEPGNDRLHAFVASLAGATPAPTAARLRDAAARELKWQAWDGDAPPAGAEFPGRMACYARLEFAAGARPVEDPATLGPVSVALASTGVEALAAYLARDVAGKAGKAALEDQLEALQLLPRLEGMTLDVGANLREGRHERGFVPHPGGTWWTLRAEGAAGAPADAGNAGARRALAVPASVLDRLAEANRLQARYDAALREIEGMRARTYADWHHAMVCAYPPLGSMGDFPNLDQVRHFVEMRSLRPLERALEETGTLSLERDPATGALTGAQAGPEDTRAARLAAALSALLVAVEALNAAAGTVAAKVAYAVRETPAERFWEPCEPVVLLAGKVARPSDRHGCDGTLACDVLPGTTPEALVADVPALRAALDGVHASRGTKGSGFRAWTAQPWNPLVLQWQAEVLPLRMGGNMDPGDSDYAPDHLTRSFTLRLHQPDLSLKRRSGGLSKAADVYTGSTPLTRSATPLLREALAAYLASAPADDPARALLARAHARLAAKDFHALSQSLGGFNQGLLMRRQTRQLPVADPLGYLADATFAARVAKAVAGRVHSAPQPLLDFNPLRTGALRLLRLRMVDSFGRARDVDCANVVTTELLKAPGDPSLAWLPPRLVPPARLDLHWLPAHGSDSPVCGWFLPNHLDGSLQVYDAAGAALGLIDAGGGWRAPGAGMPAGAEAIADPQLRRCVAWLLERSLTEREGTGFLAAFLDTVTSALETIDPEGFARDRALALLLGRPFALARATLKLEAHGPLPVHQGWNHFRREIATTRRDTNRVERVRVPLRVGEHGQLNDGVVGYWVESAGGYAGGFISPAATPAGHADVLTGAKAAAPLSLALDDPPLTLSILLDPRGVVHATTGVLPTQELSLAREQYAAALEALQVLFLTTPVLTDAGALNLPLPAEPGHRWSWLGAGDEDVTPGPVSAAAVFVPQEVREGWLRLSPDRPASGHT